MSDPEAPNGDVVETPEEAPALPFIHCEFAGELSANLTISMDKVSPVMLWGAARLIEQYADNLFEQNQLAEVMAEQPSPSGLEIVRSIPQDHRMRRRN